MATEKNGMEEKEAGIEIETLETTGFLKVVVTAENSRIPLAHVRITIASKDASDELLYELETDASGQTKEVAIQTPPFSYSQKPEAEKPYAEVVIRAQAQGYDTVVIEGVEILPETVAVQEIGMVLKTEDPIPEQIMIPEHVLYGTYPPKIKEAEVKPVIGSGEIVLSRVVIPETIVVHDGVPTDASAPDYYVSYRDYIKNVASSEIYATWTESALIANILAIMSFTLNRVYTEWYRNKGYDFTITSSTAYDQKWIYGRNIFENISLLVDELFDQYLSKPNVKQPLLTQYCDGRQVSCPNWLSQWGSQSLGLQGYTPIEILRTYYGDDIYINTAEQIAGIPASWPRYDLMVGSSGEKVKQMQEQLLTISTVYTAIPTITPSGYFDEITEDAVFAFQSIFGLPESGIVDFTTWYKISQIYVGITRIAESHND